LPLYSGEGIEKQASLRFFGTCFWGSNLSDEYFMLRNQFLDDWQAVA
jgi:hypothetical protein